MQFDQDGHSEVQRQLLITLVHGTWPRGLFPTFTRFKKRVWDLVRLQRTNRRPFWFEDGSFFLIRLSTELHDIPNKITPLLWSGANSIFVRDKTAHNLAAHLSAEHTEHPQATQLVIAHSHGGNIALRAMHHLQKRALCEAESPNPFIVTLATPFIEVQEANLGLWPTHLRNALFYSILWIPMVAILYFPFNDLLHFFAIYLSELYAEVLLGILAVVCICGLVFTVKWHEKRVFKGAIARQTRVQALNDVTHLGDRASAQRLLVIRAIDDEASLVLALGTILNYVTTKSIGIAYFVSVIWFSITMIATGADALISPPTDALIGVGWVVFTIFLFFGILMVSRSVHGRELAVSPMECQINTQSTPDAKGLSEIVTLVRHTYVKSLRHGIYDHEDCAKTISDWVRLRLD